MLSNQTFTTSRIIALGTDFFVDPLTGELDYAFVLEFSGRMFESSDHYNFHLWDLNRPEIDERIRILDAWGCPVTYGKQFYETVSRENKREFDRMLLWVDFIWAKELVSKYRIHGHKNISTSAPSGVLVALAEAMTNPDPNYLDLTLRQLG